MSSSKDTPQQPITLTIFKQGEKSKGRPMTTTWAQFFAQLADLTKTAKTTDKLKLPAWCPATFRDNYRNLANVEQVVAAVLDFDNTVIVNRKKQMLEAPVTIDTALSAWPGHLAFVYTSWSHAMGWPRFRLVLPYTRAVTREEQDLIWSWIARRLADAGQEIDTSCKDASRLWFLPARRDDNYRAVTQEGDLLDVDAILSEPEATDGPIEAFEAFEATRSSYARAAIKNECDAVAYAVEGTRNKTLNKAAFSLGQLVAGGALDEAEVTRQLLTASSACGLPVEEADRTIRSAIRSGFKHPRAASTNGHLADQVDDEWPDPHPLTESVSVPPPPWAACLPTWLWQWVRAEAIATQTPEDLAALLALSVLAICCQRRWLIRVKNGWVEPLCLYVAIILAPGNRKSAVFRAATEALYDWEAAQRAAIEAELATATTTLAIAEKKLRAAEGRAGKDGDITAVDEALAAAREFAAAQDELPVIPRLVTSDATQEAVARLLNEQGGCIGVMDAEGCGPVALMLGRYSDGTAAVDLYLRGHAGDALRVDRVGRDPIIVDHPRVSMGITVQPAVIEQLSERRELRGLGLLARILWCQPQSTVGTRDVDPPPVPTEVVERYRQAIQALLDRKPSEDGELTEVVLSSEAWLVLRAFMQELEPRLAEDGDLAPVADWASKLAGVVARVAGLLHIANHAGIGTPPITADTMSGAVVIGRYLLGHAQKVLGQMGGGDPVVTDAKAVLHFLQQRKGTEMSRRDLHQALRKGHEGRFRRAEDLDAPLTLLADRGWVRLHEQRDGGTKGRVSVVVRLNPREVGTPQKAQKPQKVETYEPCGADTGPIEPIEPIEAFEAYRLVEISCAIVGSSTIEITAQTDDDRYDQSTPEGRRAYNDYLCRWV